MRACEICGQETAIWCPTCTTDDHCGDLECMGRDCAADEWRWIAADEDRAAMKGQA